jgi:hypothetical protein
MTLTFLIGLATCVAFLLITIYYYEKRCAQLQDDLDFALGLLAADDDDRILGGAA